MPESDRSPGVRDALVREGRHDRADFRVGVGVIQVVVGVAAVEEHGLLDEPLAHHLRQKVDVLLSTRRTERDVMEAFHEIRHVSSPAFLPDCCRSLVNITGSSALTGSRRIPEA